MYCLDIIKTKKSQSSHYRLFKFKGLSKVGLQLASYCLFYHSTYHAHQHNLPILKVYSHPPHFSHSPFFSLSTELFMSLFAHAEQVLLHSLLRIPIKPAPVSTVPHSPVIEAAPSLHWPLHKDSSVPHTNKTHSYIFIKTHTHTHKHFHRSAGLS